MIHNVFVSFSYLFITNYLFMKKVQNYAGHSVTGVAVLMILNAYLPICMLSM